MIFIGEDPPNTAKCLNVGYTSSVLILLVQISVVIVILQQFCSESSVESPRGGGAGLYHQPDILIYGLKMVILCLLLIGIT